MFSEHCATLAQMIIKTKLIQVEEVSTEILSNCRGSAELKHRFGTATFTS